MFSLKIAWRNIWRNKRRTLITAASVFFAVFLSVLMQSLQKGAWDHMVDNVVNYYFGYVQVQEKNFWEERSLDNSIEVIPSLVNQVTSSTNDVLQVVPRLESFALASRGQRTQGVIVVGIDPDLENSLTQIESRITDGDYFTDTDKAILVGEGVASNFGVRVGDTLVLLSQGFRGVNSAAKYRIQGIIHFASPDLNNRMLYLPLPEAQYFYGAENRISSLILQLENRDRVPRVVRAVDKVLPNDYTVMDYQEMMPELMEAKALDEAGANIMLIILYAIIAFGIFGTILMMTKDRQYEFGVLLSIGMRRWRMVSIVWLEIVMIGLVGAIVGILASIPIVQYFTANPIKLTGEMATAYEKFGVEPILPATFEWTILLNNALLVLFITSILAIYPLLKITKMQPVNAMRQ